ncbi:MAG: exodeoxyribonuclease large subunit [Desulfovibrionales bacterium]|nr:exodeoxyribonuclease large subunit [Desulfovibrionales bacterium]
MSHILTVAQLTRAVKEVLEAGFPFVWVRGQIANLSKPSSGHIYFSLVDEKASLPVVWFKSSQPLEKDGERVNPATGEVEPGGAPQLEEGLDVLAGGRINVYEPRGVYQLVAEVVEPEGVGGAHLAFEALKRKLAAEGLFSEDRKMVLPSNPRRVAVVTAPAGAAIQDFLRVGERRGLGGEVRIYPAVVQGKSAPGAISRALARVGNDGWAEVAALIRGGGSAEDLGAFNTEEVARAVANCPVPVVSGVGHEIDTSLADLAADQRAATPTHAAQIIWEDQTKLRQDVDGREMDLRRAYLNLLESRSGRVEHLRRGLRWLSPGARLSRLASDFSGLGRRLDASWERFLRTRGEASAALGARLSQAYGLRRIDFLARRLDVLSHRLDRAKGVALDRRAERLAGLARTLDGFDPERPLRKGFCLVEVEGREGYLREARDVAPGELLRIRPARGEILARAEQVREEAD